MKTPEEITDLASKIHRYVQEGDWTRAEGQIKRALSESWQQSALLAGKDGERLKKLAELIWESRWMDDLLSSHLTISEREMANDYAKLVGVAAEIRSGNYNGIDAAMKATNQG